jgi:hypothetical protein
MASQRQETAELPLGLSEPTGSSVVHIQTLRRAVGLVALALPFVLLVGGNVRALLLGEEAGGAGAWVERSISAYFHTGMREVFVGSLSAIAVFLVCYKGYERRDDLAANVAGFCALVVALFPTDERPREVTHAGAPGVDSVTLFSGPSGPDPAFVGRIHFAAATVFFVTLAVMSIFLFTRSNQATPTPQKRLRNKVYVACGVTILVCIALIAVGKFGLGEPFEARTRFVFWLESVAVVAFGFSWLTKAEFVFGDPHPPARSLHPRPAPEAVPSRSGGGDRDRS